MSAKSSWKGYFVDFVFSSVKTCLQMREVFNNIALFWIYSKGEQYYTTIKATYIILNLCPVA